MLKLTRALGTLAPWLVIAALGWAAMFITPSSSHPPLAEPLVERRDRFFGGAELGRKIWIVGQNGAVLSSTDEGQHWQREQLPGGDHLQAIAVSPEGRLVVVGNHGRIWTRSADGPWTPRQLPALEPAGKLLDVRHIDGHFWTLGEMGALFRTDADARSWESPGSFDDISFNRIQPGAEDDLWIAAEFGCLLHSRDQGRSWSVQTLGSESLHALAFNGRTGIAVGNRGQVYVSRDAGGHWQAAPAFTREHLFDVAYFHGQWWVTGDRGALWRSHEPETGWVALMPAGFGNGWHTRLLPGAHGLAVIGQPSGLLDGDRLHPWPPAPSEPPP